MADHIDRAIDEEAHALTAGEPDAAFRARIVARLDQDGPARRAWWIVAPLAAAATIAIAVTMWSMRDRTTPAAPNPAVARRETPAPQPRPPRVDTPAAPERTTAANAARAERTAPPRAARNRGASVTAGPSEASVVAELAPPPLDVPSIAVAPIDRGPSLQLDQLAAIAPIAVAPLDEAATAREPER
jgi:hypothetical protein